MNKNSISNKQNKNFSKRKRIQKVDGTFELTKASRSQIFQLVFLVMKYGRYVHQLMALFAFKSVLKAKRNKIHRNLCVSAYICLYI